MFAGIPLVLTIAQELNKVDPAVKRALALLKPADQPMAPIRALGPDELFIFKHRPTAEGTIDARKGEVLLNKIAPSFNNDKLLASVIAHENVHLQQAKDAKDYFAPLPEQPAYRRQFEVLRSLRYPDQGYMEALRRQMNYGHK